MNTNKAIVNKAGAITTSVVSSGLLQPYQAKKFLQQTFDATPLMQAIRHEVRTEKSGEIDKIGIGKRKLRGKMENVDDGYRAGVESTKLPLYVFHGKLQRKPFARILKVKISKMLSPIL